jgi:hypothetical protein
MFGLGINIYSGEDLPLNESDFLTEEEKVLSEKKKETVYSIFVFLSGLYFLTL